MTQEPPGHDWHLERYREYLKLLARLLTGVEPSRTSGKPRQNLFDASVRYPWPNSGTGH